jgi:hypothetical protein
LYILPIERKETFNVGAFKMPAYIQNSNGTTKPVKNLGWLLRNWKLVDHFVFNKNEADQYNDGVLCAILKDGRKFLTLFASEAVLWDVFLRRPVFYGLSITTIRRNNKPNVTETIQPGGLSDWTSESQQADAES